MVVWNYCIGARSWSCAILKVPSNKGTFDDLVSCYVTTLVFYDSCPVYFVLVGFVLFLFFGCLRNPVY